MKALVTEAEAYRAIATFDQPSMSADSISIILSSMATSLTNSKTEMTDLNTGGSRVVRMDVTRERKGTIGDDILSDDWLVFNSNSKVRFVQAISSWNRKTDNFCKLIDPAVRSANVSFMKSLLRLMARNAMVHYAQCVKFTSFAPLVEKPDIRKSTKDQPRATVPRRKSERETFYCDEKHIF